MFYTWRFFFSQRLFDYLRGVRFVGKIILFPASIVVDVRYKNVKRISRTFSVGWSWTHGATDSSGVQTFGILHTSNTYFGVERVLNPEGGKRKWAKGRDQHPGWNILNGVQKIRTIRNTQREKIKNNSKNPVLYYFRF